MPEFSVIVPIYNVEKYIEKSIKSLLKQTFQDFEIICVNDCTPDNSMEIVEKFAQNDSRIKIINNEKNLGTGVSRNKAVEIASGKYLTCVDPDDWAAPTYLETLYNGFKEHDVDSVWVKYWEYSEGYDFAHISYMFPALSHFKGGDYTLTPKTIPLFPAYPWNKAYKTKLIKDNFYSWMSGVYFEDVYFYFNYFIDNPKIYIVNEMLYYYRQRKGSVTTSTDIIAKKMDDMYKVLGALYRLFEAQERPEEAKQSVLEFGENFHNQYKNTPSENLAKIMYSRFMCEYDE